MVKNDLFFQIALNVLICITMPQNVCRINFANVVPEIIKEGGFISFKWAKIDEIWLHTSQTYQMFILRNSN